MDTAGWEDTLEEENAGGKDTLEEENAGGEDTLEEEDVLEETEDNGAKHFILKLSIQGII